MIQRRRYCERHCRVTPYAELITLMYATALLLLRYAAKISSPLRHATLRLRRACHTWLFSMPRHKILMLQRMPADAATHIS